MLYCLPMSHKKESRHKRDKLMNTVVSIMARSNHTLLISTMTTGIFLPFQNRDPGPMILGKIICISVKLGKWIQNRTGDNMPIWC